MRGQLSIRSARAPYRRAGLGWPSREAIEADIRTLNGERLFKLLSDPILTVKISDENGAFRAFPAMPSGYGPNELQLMIDSLGEELPDLPAAPIDPVLADGGALEGLADRLMEAGVANIDQLFDKLAVTAANQRAAMNSLKATEEELESAQAQLIERNAELIERNNELILSRERVAELEAAVNAASSSQPAAEEQPQETKPAPRKAAAKKG